MTFYLGFMKIIAVLWMMVLLPIKTILKKYGAVVLSIVLVVMAGIAFVFYPVMLTGLLLVIIIGIFNFAQSYTYKYLGLVGLLAVIIFQGGIFVVLSLLMINLLETAESTNKFSAYILVGWVGLAIVAIIIANLVNALQIIRGAK